MEQQGGAGMILQSLVQLYEDLAKKGGQFRPGWGVSKVSYALCLNDEGDIIQSVSLKDEQLRGNKTVLLPREMSVPAPVKRSVGIVPNFLCDHSGYLLGVDNKGNAQRSLECFAACRAFHEEILSGVDSAAAKAVLAFFSKWKPENAKECEALLENFDDITSGVNLVFQYYEGVFVLDDPLIGEAWQKRQSSCEGKESRICLVTGETAPVAKLHPSIKGIQGAQSSGASLVSFNAPAFCSYRWEQGSNASTSKYAASAYGAALNYLISDREHTTYIGDTIVLFWALGAEVQYQSAFGSFAFGFDSKYTDNDLRGMMSSLCKGNPVEFDEAKLDPNREFYVLGIAPNAARISVRFFMHGTFGNIIQNVKAHYDRLEIEKPSFKTGELTLWRILNETVNENSRDKSASPQLSGELLRSILNDSRYPATLLNGIVLRIRAEHDIPYEKAAILKAYYLKNKHKDVPEEVLTVSLNRESSNPAYVLGRLFSVLEDIQEAANPGINATIKDKYFNSASATPAVVFPTLINLSQKHIKKLEHWEQVKFEKQMGEIMSLLHEEFPSRLSLPQQGAFQLGYYHQTQARYTNANK